MLSYNKIIFSLSILFGYSIYLVSCINIEIALIRIEQIGNITNDTNNISQQKFKDHLIEFTNLIKDLYDNNKESLKEASIKSKLDSSMDKMIKNISDHLDNVSGSSDRKRILEVLYKLRPYAEKIFADGGSSEHIKKLDFYLTLYRFDYIYSLAMRDEDSSESSSDSGDEPEDVLSLLPEYNRLKEGTLNKLSFNGDVKRKITELDLVFDKLEADEIFHKLMSPIDLNNVISNREIEFLNELYLKKDKELNKKFPQISYKLKTLKSIGSLKPDRFKCHVSELKKIDKLKGLYGNGLQIQPFIEMARQRLIAFCINYIETEIKNQIKLDIGIDGAMARLNSLVKFILKESGSTGYLNDNELDVKDLARNIVNFIEQTGHLESSDETISQILMDFDLNYDAFIKRHCKQLELMIGYYEFLHVLSRQSGHQLGVRHWIKQLMRNGNICRRVYGTNGHDWYLVVRFMKESTIDKIVQDRPGVESELVFKSLENLIMEAPSVSKVLGEHDLLDELNKYKDILNFWKTPASAYKVTWFRSIRDISLANRKNMPGLYRALEDLRMKRISELLTLLHTELDTRGAIIQPRLLEALTKLRVSLEMSILGNDEPSAENRVKKVYRKGISKEMIKNQLDNMSASGETSESSKSSDILRRTRAACNQIMLDMVRQDIYLWIGIMQEQDDYRLMSNRDIDFLIDVSICKNFPFVDEPIQNQQ